MNQEKPIYISPEEEERYVCKSSSTKCVLPRAMVQSLVTKCNLTESQVVVAHQEFNETNPSGLISKEQFIKSMRVSELINLEDIILTRTRTTWLQKVCLESLMKIAVELSTSQSIYRSN